MSRSSCFKGPADPEFNFVTGMAARSPRGFLQGCAENLSVEDSSQWDDHPTSNLSTAERLASQRGLRVTMFSLTM